MLAGMVGYGAVIDLTGSVLNPGSDKALRISWQRPCCRQSHSGIASMYAHTDYVPEQIHAGYFIRQRTAMTAAIPAAMNSSQEKAVAAK
ncbi:hypothetical protein EDC30_10980 [Paucimonas lemoignei]|uniref:Uncharacterized protein n=1 Tax=Paucimonas lemoignei TaxID=29443 RepID=A0A4R3HUD8_PAULE|nr:hypothetical protein [Paucimonas lemoignei]TCS35781.1 hypothetical protein EDC30_10980 [Paucimonas lemoignei]